MIRHLSDPKAEVRQVAGSSLSGMIKGMSATESAELRDTFLGTARRLFGKKRRDADAADVQDAPLEAKHGCLQGLKAFLMSTPYDCPEWVPSVLLALVMAASNPSAEIRTTVSKIVSEFKRTHEQDSLEELRAMTEADQWESIQQITSQASYFA